MNTFGGLWYLLSPSGDEITTPTGSGGALAISPTRELGEQRTRRGER
jgi:hypothetical protein